MSIVAASDIPRINVGIFMNVHQTWHLALLHIVVLVLVVVVVVSLANDIVLTQLLLHPQELSIMPLVPPPPASHDVYTLSNDEIAVFRLFVSQFDHSSMTPTSFTHSGTITYGFSVSFTTPQSPWIIDSGASYHMISMSSLFTSYQVCSGKDKVCIADGSLLLLLVRVIYLLHLTYASLRFFMFLTFH